MQECHCGKFQVSLKKKPTTPYQKKPIACSACRKAHVSCDNKRPCSRCVKRNMADSCCDPQKRNRHICQAPNLNILPANCYTPALCNNIPLDPLYNISHVIPMDNGVYSVIPQTNLILPELAQDNNIGQFWQEKNPDEGLDCFSILFDPKYEHVFDEYPKLSELHISAVENNENGLEICDKECDKCPLKQAMDSNKFLF